MITWHDGNLNALLSKIHGNTKDLNMAAAKDMADTLLILSRYEVPHDEGTLQSSGHTEADTDGWLVVYNTIYAAYQHEGVRKDGTHVVMKHQKGRKTKYLEDPQKMNMSIWQDIARKKLLEALNGKI